MVIKNLSECKQDLKDKVMCFIDRLTDDDFVDLEINRKESEISGYKSRSLSLTIKQDIVD